MPHHQPTVVHNTAQNSSDNLTVFPVSFRQLSLHCCQLEGRGQCDGIFKGIVSSERCYRELRVESKAQCSVAQLHTAIHSNYGAEIQGFFYIISIYVPSCYFLWAFIYVENICA